MDLRILLVEDNDADAELVLRRLRENGYSPRSDRVASEAALRVALDAQGWDVALVDYNLPGFSGPAALRLLAEVAPDLPAITVSGAISEETAVATLTAGAVDYVLKDNLTRLAPAVQRAVDGAALRRRQRSDAELARRTQFAIDHASQAIVYVDERGIILYLNEAAGRLAGVTPSETVGQSIWRWSPVVDEKRWGELWLAATQRPVVDFEAPMHRPDGEELLVSVTLDFHESGDYSFVIVNARDITAQRAAEARAVQSEARYERLAENAPDIIFRYDLVPTLRLAYINQAVEAITGYSREECYADPQLMISMAHPEDAPLMADMVRSLEPPEGPFVMRWVGKDGTVRWMETRVVLVHDEQGQPIAVEGITRDITERRRVEEKLLFTQFIVEQSSDPIFWMTESGAIRYANRQTCEALGYSLAELCTMTIHDIDLDHPAESRLQHLQEMSRTGSLTFETHHRRKDGRDLPVEVTAMLLEYDGEVYDVAFARDVTERRRIEAALRESEERFEAFANHFPGYLFMHDETLRYVYVNRQDTADGEVTRRDWLGKTPSQVWAGEVGVEEEERARRAMQGKVVDAVVLWTPPGLREYMHSIYFPIPRPGKPTLVGGMSIDVTEQHEAEEEVRRQAEQLRRTVQGAVLAMSHVVETRDPYTAGHERRVAELAAAIGAELGLAGEELEALRLAALIHDIGKIAVPAEILAKPGRLSEVEFNLIRQHPELGYDILEAIDFGRPVAEYVLQHHERLDGSGYPRGLAGEEVLPEARIIAVADVVEAMSSHRPYRAALGLDAALDEVSAHAGVRYDADVVAACVRLFREQGFTLTP